MNSGSSRRSFIAVVISGVAWLGRAPNRALARSLSACPHRSPTPPICDRSADSANATIHTYDKMGRLIAATDLGHTIAATFVYADA